MQRLLLQIAILVGGFVPVVAGLGGVLDGPEFAGLTAAGGASSHLRYLSGLLLGIGLGFWSTVPRIERHALRFRVLTFVVLVGGLSRLLGVVLLGDPPSRTTLFALMMELAVTPALCLWQNNVARSS